LSDVAKGLKGFLILLSPIIGLANAEESQGLTWIVGIVETEAAKFRNCTEMLALLKKLVGELEQLICREARFARFGTNVM
jgi:hypothetical protein